MPQSLSNIMIHVVFSTKHRAPILDDAWRDDLHAYIGGMIRKRQSDLLAANSVEDHIHLLFPLPRTISIANMVKEIKTGSTNWIQTRDRKLSHFHWQAGYGAFSISPNHKETVQKYIARQQEHHRKISFREEYLRLLKKYDIPYDDKYIWD